MLASVQLTASCIVWTMPDTFAFVSAEVVCEARLVTNASSSRKSFRSEMTCLRFAGSGSELKGLHQLGCTCRS